MKDCYKKRLTPRQIFTVPNILSFIRLIMIPAIIVLYFNDYYILSVCLIALSGLTDVADGIIARKFKLVSDLGKVLDPLADKLTQLSLVICLSIKYVYVLILFAVMLIKDGLLFLWGLKAFKRDDEVNSSRWFGKLATVVSYVVIAFLFLCPLLQIEANIVYILIVIPLILNLLSLILYGVFYKKKLVKGK